MSGWRAYRHTNQRSQNALLNLDRFLQRPQCHVCSRQLQHIPQRRDRAQTEVAHLALVVHFCGSAWMDRDPLLYKLALVLRRLGLRPPSVVTALVGIGPPLVNVGVVKSFSYAAQSHAPSKMMMNTAALVC